MCAVNSFRICVDFQNHVRSLTAASFFAPGNRKHPAWFVPQPQFASGDERLARSHIIHVSSLRILECACVRARVCVCVCVRVYACVPCPCSFLYFFVLSALLKIYKVDPRIHFALNCGARSCPPIRIYNSKNLGTSRECRLIKARHPHAIFFVHSFPALISTLYLHPSPIHLPSSSSSQFLSILISRLHFISFL